MPFTDNFKKNWVCPKIRYMDLFKVSLKMLSQNSDGRLIYMLRLTKKIQKTLLSEYFPKRSQAYWRFWGMNGLNVLAFPMKHQECCLLIWQLWQRQRILKQTLRGWRGYFLPQRKYLTCYEQIFGQENLLTRQYSCHWSTFKRIKGVKETATKKHLTTLAICIVMSRYSGERISFLDYTPGTDAYWREYHRTIPIRKENRKQQVKNTDYSGNIHCYEQIFRQENLPSRQYSWLWHIFKRLTQDTIWIRKEKRERAGKKLWQCPL